jgi:uncharacterized protein
MGTSEGALVAGGRSETIDVLRGFALLGVLAVNLYFIAGEARPGTDVDRAATWLREFVFTAKSYSLLALLFGLGFAIQRERARSPGRDFPSVFARRALVLLALGILHGVFLWWGDVLAVYALLGLFLLRFQPATPRGQLVWVVGLLGSAALVELGLAGLTALAPGAPDAPAQPGAGPAGPAEEAIRLYTTGGYLDITAARARQWATTAASQLLLSFPNFYSMILLGLWLGDRAVFADPERHRFLLRRFALLGLAVGIPANAAYATAATFSGPQWPGFYVAAALYTVGAPALMLGYLGSIALLRREGGGAARLLAPLAAVGRLSLSNYLLQSLAMNLLVYGYGLGLYGRVGAAAGLGLALAIFLGQVALSNLYARAFSTGPAEALWRALAYR